MPDRLRLLTPTERRIAELLAQGLTYLEVGPLVNANPHNISVYVSRGIYRKLGVNTLAQLTRWWIYNVELQSTRGESG